MSATSRRKKAAAFYAETSRTTVLTGRYVTYNPDAHGLVEGDGGRMVEIFDVLPGAARPCGPFPAPEGTFTIVVTFVPAVKKEEL